MAEKHIFPKYPDPEAIVFKPMVPYWGDIPGGFQPDKFIEIMGFVPSSADEFNVNLLSTSKPGVTGRPDRPLHISIRLNSKVIVLNSYHNGNWDTEERKEDVPFQRARPFSMLILAENHCYRIAVNGVHKWEFNYRLPILSNSTLHISGSVRIDEICYRKQPLVPNTTNVIESHSNEDRQLMVSRWNLIPPYFYVIDGGLWEQQIFQISGCLKGDAISFTINFSCCCTEVLQMENIAFHFDARFSTSDLVRNSRINGTWGKEESDLLNFPFSKGVHFDMMIQIRSDKFMVAINGQHFLEYRHRVFPISKINEIGILGDIRIASFRATM